MFLVYCGAANAFEDDENCLMCHKYPKMGRITEEGIRKYYYIMPNVFSKTVHRNVPCRDCHNYIKELPHKPVTEGVNCAQECHSIKNPATGKPFTHKPIYDVYKQSVHGREKVAKGLDADKPYCITCHTNPLYNPDEDRPPAKIVIDAWCATRIVASSRSGIAIPAGASARSSVRRRRSWRSVPLATPTRT